MNVLHVKALKQREQEAGMFRHFQVIRGKGIRGGLESISITINPEEDEQQWVFRKIYDQQLMAEEIIKRNQKHFGQAKGSPPTDPEIEKLLGKYGENGLQGLENCLQADLQEHLPEAIALLASLVQNRLPIINTDISVAEIKKY